MWPTGQTLPMPGLRQGFPKKKIYSDIKIIFFLNLANLKKSCDPLDAKILHKRAVFLTYFTKQIINFKVWRPSYESRDR